MTTNQLIAMGFPLITAAAVGITGLFVRKPWAEKHDDELLSTGTRAVFDVEAVEAIEEAERLIRGAQQELQRAKAPGIEKSLIR